MHVQRLTTNNKLPTSIRIRLLWNHDAMICPFMQLHLRPECRVLLNNLTWAVGSKITLYWHVFFLSLWCSLEIRTDHPCWLCVLTLHEMHTIMQIVLKVIKPCSSLRAPTLPPSPPHSCSPLFGCGEIPQFWMAAKEGWCSRRAFVIRDAPGKEASWGNISKVGAGWNGSFLRCICSSSHCVSMYSSTYRVVGQAFQLADRRLPQLWSSINTVKGLAACRCCNYTVQVVCAQAPLAVTPFLFSLLKESKRPVYK